MPWDLCVRSSLGDLGGDLGFGDLRFGDSGFGDLGIWGLARMELEHQRSRIWAPGPTFRSRSAETSTAQDAPPQTLNFPLKERAIPIQQGFSHDVTYVCL